MQFDKDRNIVIVLLLYFFIRNLQNRPQIKVNERLLLQYSEIKNISKL